MNGDELCAHCEQPIATVTEETTTEPEVVMSAQFLNGIGAVTATSRLATFARRENLLLAIAAAIAMDYFAVLSHVSALGGVC